jgi:crotonobetainyl-CoA:carnitine CoA-transferase CaiB-like acyl-CoA transferase
MSSAGNIFCDLKVVDPASYIAGPVATTILADLGATAGRRHWGTAHLFLRKSL